MNASQPYLESHSQPHMSASQPYGSYPAPSSHYQPYQQPPPGPSHYGPGPQYQSGGYGYTNAVPQSPQSVGHHNPAAQVSSQAIQLPAMHMPAPNPPHSYVTTSQPPAPGYQPQPQQQHQMDTTGQTGPPGIKPKVTATLWEDEGSLCFQVEAKGVCVARREDNHFINGTKLLNVAGMTRGRRDGILKSEKVRHVVKIGPMHLKGVWIPFERALDFANKEKITDQLYPLFVHNIGSLLYNPDSINRPMSQAPTVTERRRMDSTDPGRPTQASQPPALQHHHSMQNTVGSQPQHSIAPHPEAGRPSIGRAHTFPNVPTPPTSASSVMGMGNQASSYNWDGQNMANSVAGTQPLSIDTGLSNNARSMPTTPATTPPGGPMQPYQHQQSYDQKPYSSYPPASQNGYAPQPRMNTYPQDSSFKSEMGPPSAPGAVSSEAEHHDSKVDVYNHVNGSADSGHHEQSYSDPNASAYGANRSHYSYNPAATHQHVSPEMTSSPSHQTNSGRGTPRTMPGGPQQWPQDFQTPPRSAPTSSVYSVMGDSRSSNGGSGEYTASSYSNSSQPATSNKRGREDDDHDRPASRDLDYKRQKSYGAPMGSASHMQAIATGGGMPRQR